MTKRTQDFQGSQTFTNLFLNIFILKVVCLSAVSCKHSPKTKYHRALTWSGLLTCCGFISEYAYFYQRRKKEQETLFQSP